VFSPRTRKMPAVWRPFGIERILPHSRLGRQWPAAARILPAR
jgi:hypothetical protein